MYDGIVSRRFAKICQSQISEEVLLREYKISDKPMFTEHLYNCNGVVLLGDGYAALSHNTIEDRPDDLLTRLLDELRSKSGVELATAVLVGGEGKHIELNRRELDELGVPVINEYFGRLGEGKTHPILGGEYWNRKDIAVVPRTKTVLVRAIGIVPPLLSLPTKECELEVVQLVPVR